MLLPLALAEVSPCMMLTRYQGLGGCVTNRLLVIS